MGRIAVAPGLTLNAPFEAALRHELADESASFVLRDDGAGMARELVAGGWPALRDEIHRGRGTYQASASDSLASSPFADVTGVFEAVAAEDTRFAVGCGVEGGSGRRGEGADEAGVGVVEFPAGLFE